MLKSGTRAKTQIRQTSVEVFCRIDPLIPSQSLVRFGRGFRTAPAGLTKKARGETPGCDPAKGRALKERTTRAGTEHVAMRVTAMTARGVARRLQGAPTLWTVNPGFRCATPRALLVCPAGALTRAPRGNRKSLTAKHHPFARHYTS
jgi:hypothetical protein